MQPQQPSYGFGPSANEALLWRPQPEEQRLLDDWFGKLGGVTGRVPGAETAAFLLLSGLDKLALRSIWSMVDSKNEGFLTRQGFYNVMRLVTLALQHRPVSIASLQATAHERLPLPLMQPQQPQQQPYPQQYPQQHPPYFPSGVAQPAVMHSHPQPQPHLPAGGAVEDDEFGDFEDASSGAGGDAAGSTVTTAGPSLLDVSNPFNDFMSTATAAATPLPQTSDHTDAFASLQDDILQQPQQQPSRPMTLPGGDAVKQLGSNGKAPIFGWEPAAPEPETPGARSDDFGDFEQAADEASVPSQAQATAALSKDEDDMMFFDDGAQGLPQQDKDQAAVSQPSSTETAPFRGVDDDWKKRMAALDDLVELDLASSKEEWQDCESSTQSAVAPPAAATTEPAKKPVALDDILSLAVAPAPAPAPVPAPAPAPAPEELDLLDFDAPVVEQQITVTTTPAVIPLDLGLQSISAPKADEIDDEWTEFEEVPPIAHEQPEASDQVTPAELELLAEQLHELKHYDCAYQCLHFCELLKRNDASNPLTKEYQQQLGRWREILQRTEQGEGVDEVIEIMEQVEQTCAERYKKGFLSIASSNAPDLRTRVIRHLICKRAARVMLTTRTTHIAAREGWDRLLVKCHELLEQCVQRLQAFPRLSNEDQAVVRAQPAFQTFIHGMLECLTCCTYLLASHKEAGLIPSSHKPELYKAALVSLAPFLTEAELKRCKSMTIDGLIAEAAIKAASLHRCGFCNFTLRPLVASDGTVRAAKQVGNAHYIFSIAQLWNEVVGEPLPQADSVFD